MNEIVTHKKGLWLSGIIILAILTFTLNLIFAVISLFFSSALGIFSSILGESTTPNILGSLINLTASALGLYSSIQLWRLKKLGALLFILSLLLTILSGFLSTGSISYFLLTVFSVWSAFILLNMKKYS